MGNVTVFEKAFKECGIGGRFSKFQLIQRAEWFELVNVDTMTEAKFCFKIFDRVDTRRFTEIDSSQAINMHPHCSQWLTHFQTAQKVIAKIISKGTIKNENRYYYDATHDSVYLINRMFVIEVTPVVRYDPNICTHAVFSYLDQCGYRPPVDVDRVIVHTQFDQVVIEYNDQRYMTRQGTDEFNQYYGVSV